MSTGSAPRDGAAVRLPPPLLFLLVLLLGIVGQVLWGGSLPLSRTVGLVLATGLALLGLSLMLWAVRLFELSDQDPKPWLATPELIFSGVYRVTRNPMYLGLSLLQAAFGFGLRSPWVLLLVPVSMVGVYCVAIRHEEAYLEQKFGEPFIDYKSRVRRWL